MACTIPLLKTPPFLFQDMPKRKATIDDVIALDETRQEEIQVQADEAAKKAKKAPKNAKKKVPGVLHVRQLPRVLDEQDLKEYFAQFGKVEKVKLARSTRTANSKGYAFVLFADSNIAKIASETMNGYLLFTNLLKCRTLYDFS